MTCKVRGESYVTPVRGVTSLHLSAINDTGFTRGKEAQVGGVYPLVAAPSCRHVTQFPVNIFLIFGHYLYLYNRTEVNLIPIKHIAVRG